MLGWLLFPFLKWLNPFCFRCVTSTVSHCLFTVAQLRASYRGTTKVASSTCVGDLAFPNPCASSKSSLSCMSGESFKFAGD
ncbi:hypothetical protein MLD38_019769 [Melastoma candidum]|uniref:Uncharacterized protein n=1 Tax=Melastoma candidum TaxID=119954 RepID=A0ACB9QXI0_9MYRT|nr:hypothetical protein MLD38_019769 [Melastoma candidum]